MEARCRVCGEPVAAGPCYVRMEDGEFPACRRCWEQVVLAPRLVLQSLRRTRAQPGSALETPSAR